MDNSETLCIGNPIYVDSGFIILTMILVNRVTVRIDAIMATALISGGKSARIPLYQLNPPLYSHSFT